MKYFVRCIKANKRNPNDKNFTVGKVYEVTEKGIVDDTGFKYISYTYGVENNVAALNKWFNPCGYKFELANDDIKRVIFNDPATVILWADGTKTVAKAVKGDKYDPEKGFAIAYAKKFNKTFREEMEKWCKTVEPVAEVTLGGFKVGDRVSFRGHMGTVACIKEHHLGVKMDERSMGYHDCGGFDLLAGDYPTGMCSRWLAPDDVNRAYDKPLTIEELKKMHGKKVWLSSLYEGEECFDDNYCGWHEVDVHKNTLTKVDGWGGYDIPDMTDPMGYRAYLTPQTRKEG